MRSDGKSPSDTDHRWYSFGFRIHNAGARGRWDASLRQQLHLPMSTRIPVIGHWQAPEWRRLTMSITASDRDSSRLHARSGAAPMSSLAKSMLLSQLLACVIPACLAVYWLVFPSSEDLLSMFFRPAIFATSIMMSLLWCRIPVTWTEKKL